MSDLKSRIDHAAAGHRPSRGVADTLEGVHARAARRDRVRRVVAGGVALCIAVAGVAVAVVSLRPPESRSAGAATTKAEGFALVTLPDGAPQILRLDLATDASVTITTLPASSLELVQPDIAVTPSGSDLLAVYPVSDTEERIALIDPSTGKIVDEEPITDVIGTKLPEDYLAVSETHAFVYRSVVTGAGATADAISTYDIAEQALLPDSIRLGNCGGAGLLFAAGSSLVVDCDIPRQLHVITVSKTGKAATDQTVALPAVEHDGSSVDELTDFVIGGDVSPDGRFAYLVTQAGSVYTIDIGSASFAGETKLPIGSGTYPAFDGFSLSADGKTGYVATGAIASFDAFSATAVQSFSVGTWEHLNTVHLPSVALGKLVVEDDHALLFDHRTDEVVDVTNSARAAANVSDIGLPRAIPVDIEAPR